MGNAANGFELLTKTLKFQYKISPSEFSNVVAEIEIAIVIKFSRIFFVIKPAKKLFSIKISIFSLAIYFPDDGSSPAENLIPKMVLIFLSLHLHTPFRTSNGKGLGES